MARPRRVLTPVVITERYPNRRGTRLENWAAKTTDGIWSLHRLEMTGTPWEAVHEPTGASGGWYGSLVKARAAIADGTALAHAEAWQREHGAVA